VNNMKNIKKDMTPEKITGVFGDTQNSKVMCICGHEEGVHHHHKDHAWGTYSWCTRCTECVWDMNKGCYTFREGKNIECPCKDEDSCEAYQRLKRLDLVHEYCTNPEKYGNEK